MKTEIFKRPDKGDWQDGKEPILCTHITDRYWPESEKLKSIYLDVSGTKTKDSIEVQLQHMQRHEVPMIVWRSPNDPATYGWHMLYPRMTDWFKSKLKIGADRVVTQYITCHNGADGSKLVVIDQYAKYGSFASKPIKDADEPAE